MHCQEYYSLIEAYLENIRANEDDIADENTTKNIENNVISIKNPQKVVTRGRPKSTSHNKML
ncbi:11530_t:CDS:2 [Gigaspora margarita]|uniref:11530_t:CDS:1 n=1 Tax=Gigaspora margarita TaxID=4874 RepID=A0ABM8W3J6_GIGMA|nr:11530_t:CDS:2 [Gigaspora margarita]